MKIKIVSGFTEKGGSTTALINLTNYFNDNGIDCTFYGNQTYHLDKCKSDLMSNLSYDSDDIVITHFLELNERPNVKKVILSCHEKWWFPIGKIKKYWDVAVFLHEEHRKYHSNYHGSFALIPNFKENLKRKEKKENNLIAGIIGTIEERKQTHVSIQRALSDDVEKIYLFGHVGDKNYYDNYVKPLLLPKIIEYGHTTEKQLMYDMIGRVYHSSKGEVACLVKDECYLTDTLFFGNSETENKVSELNNSEVFNLWIKLLS